MPRWRKRNLAVCCLTGLTHADGCDDRGGDDGQGHTARDGEVPLVARRLLQLVVGVDLQQREQHGSSSFVQDKHTIRHSLTLWIYIFHGIQCVSLLSTWLVIAS